MRLVDYIITDVRNHTENTDFSDTIGIADSEFLRFLNDAQYRIHSKITQTHPSVFLEEYACSVVNGQEEYSLPFNVHMGNKVSNIEFSTTGNAVDYFPLQRSNLKRRYGGAIGDPLIYIRKSGKILLNPVPTGGSLRFTYVKSVPRVDKRRGSVATITTSGSSITSLILNVSTDSVDGDELAKHSRITICDSEGNIKMKNIHIDSVNASTGEVIVNSAFTFETGESISVGDYVVAGRYSTSHSILDDSVERYLVAYCAMKIFHRDSNTDITQQVAELQAMEEEIVAGYADISDDISEIPVIVSDDDAWWGF